MPRLRLGMNIPRRSGEYPNWKIPLLRYGICIPICRETFSKFTTNPNVGEMCGSMSR